MINTFGMVSEEMIQYAAIPKTTFSRDVSASVNPRPGDVVKTLWNNRTYEIVDVHEESQIFQLKKLIWEFILKPYRFSDTSDSSRELSDDIDDTLTQALTAYGDNEWIEEKSDSIDNYDDVDESVYGY
jgi:hypothetical protein